MFSHRLKIEFRENRIYALLWILVLMTLTISIISIWNSDPITDPATGRPDSAATGLIGLLLLPLILLPIVSTITSFRQDNLKDPRAFWNTRPIRPATLHSTKFVFLHLLFTLPLTLCTFIVSINATTMSTSLIYAAESALWSAAAIHLCALCALHNHQGAKLLLIPAIGLFGIITTAFLISRFHLTQPNTHQPGRYEGNLLFTTTLLLILFVIAGVYLIKKPRTNYPLWAPLLVGSLTFPLLSANWLPNFSNPTETMDYERTEPITAFTTSSTRINQQHFYLLNFALEDFLGDTDRIPIDLVYQRIDSAPLSEFQSDIRVELKSWNTGTDRLAGDNNLKNIALDHQNNSDFRVSLSFSIPHDHSIQTVPQIDDLPRKDITFEGAVDILTVSLEDAQAIDPEQEFTGRTSGRIFTFLPSNKKGRPNTIQSEHFRLPLASSDLLQPGRRSHFNEILVAMRHRGTGQYFLIPERGSSSRRGTFGEVHSSELQNPEETMLVNYNWENQLKKKFPDFPDYNDWKKDADLLILPPEQFKTIRIPFKVTVAVPDLDLLQQRLNDSPG